MRSLLYESGSGAGGSGEPGNTQQEGPKSVFEVPDVSPRAFVLMLHYMHTDQVLLVLLFGDAFL